MLTIIIGILLLIILVYNRVSVIIAAPLAIFLVSVLKGYHPLDILTGEYIEGVTFFIEDFIFVFLLGAILGKIMTNSGAARTIAEYIIKTMGARRGTSAVLITSALLTYGGIPGFVIVFTIYPISLPVFREANLPRYLLPACFAGGIANLSIPMPGSPQVHNIIPIETLDTGPLSGLGPGFVGAALSFLLALVYLEFRAHRARVNDQGFSGDISKEAGKNREEIKEKNKAGEKNEENDPGIIKSLTPLIVVIVSLSLVDVTVITALTLGVIASIALFYKHIGSTIPSLNEGVRDSLTPLLFAASAVGFGLTLRAFPEFEAFLQSIIELSIDPLITSSIITNLGAGLMGSASGGIVLTMSLAGEGFIAEADPHSLHRIVVMSSSVLDTVPFNNGYLAILAFTGLSLKDTYLDFFVTTVLIPMVGLITALALFIL